MTTRFALPLHRERMGRKHSMQRMVKSCLDYLGAGILIILLSPVLVLVGVLVAVESGWPVIYRRRVVGVRGEFDAYKFRTMKQDADEVLAADPELRAEFEKNFKLRKDPRLTRWGAVLRRSSLDELPQLFNVLWGQMSLVGPRMVTPEELEKYGTFKELRRTVKPGITGYWQVHGRQEVCYEERVRMDKYYIENWSLGIDVRILMKTPLKVLRKEGAY